MYISMYFYSTAIIWQYIQNMLTYNAVFWIQIQVIRKLHLIC